MDKDKNMNMDKDKNMDMDKRTDSGKTCPPTGWRKNSSAFLLSNFLFMKTLVSTAEYVYSIVFCMPYSVDLY